MRVAKILPILLLFPLVAAADEKSPPAGWKEWAPKNKAYVAWYPNDGKVVESETSIASSKFGQIRSFRAILERKDGSLFATSQIILPPKLLRAPAKARQDLFRDVCLEEFRGKILEEKKVQLGTMPGREYLIKTPGGMARFGLYGTGAQVFRILIIGSKDQLQSKDAETFFTSLKRTSKVTPKKEDNKQGYYPQTSFPLRRMGERGALAPLFLTTNRGLTPPARQKVSASYKLQPNCREKKYGQTRRCPSST